MLETPASPQAARLAAPSWLDARLVLGVLLVLGSVLLGAKVLSGADRSQPVWVAARDLAPGTVLVQGDLQVARARLFDHSASYVAASGAAPVGYVLRRGIGTGELLPYALLAQGADGLRYRDVSVPVAAGHSPADLRRGEQVDVYLSPGERAAPVTPGGAAKVPRRVLSAVDVAAVRVGSGLASSAQDLPVVLAVGTDQVLPLVQAMGQGRIDLVRVPRAQQQTPSALATAVP